MRAITNFNSVIYEVNIRQYTPQGTFKAFMEHLPRLKELGVDILWFMPIYPIGITNRKGTLGSYYSVSDYTGVNSEFGTFEEFKEIVDLAHSMGMRVILDMVTNHTSWNNIWLESGKLDWYERDEDGNVISPFDWSDTAKLNYKSAEMRLAMIESHKYWLTKAGIDGYRQDMAGLVPLDFWQELITSLKEVKPDVFMLGEVDSPQYYGENLFDATYAWDTCHLLEHIAQHSPGADGLRGRLEHEKYVYPHNAIRMLFTSNHDENSWSGSEFERLGDATECMIALTYMLNGMPLIYSGQESGVTKRIKFFERDTIEWDFTNKFTPLYQDLNKLRHNNPSLDCAGEGGEIQYLNCSQPQNVMAFKRYKDGNEVIAIFNLTPYHVQPAFWDMAYNGEWDKFQGGKVNLYEGEYDPFGPWEYKIYFREYEE